MIYSSPHQIGVLACPGGAVFADKLISELEYLSQKGTRRKVDILAQKYDMSPEQIIRQINLSLDLRPTTMNFSNPQDRIRAIHYRVPAVFTRFANGEYKTEITSTVRNSDLYIIQDVENQYPVTLNEGDSETYTLSINDHIFCLLVSVDAALQAGARSVTVVLPTYPYARQHKKKGREGLTAARVGQILENLGVARILTLDLHSKEIENSFNRLRVENLHASYQILKVLNQVIDLRDPDLVIVSPDTGSVDRNKFYSTALNKALGMIYKERDYTRASLSATQNNITHIRLLGDVKGKTVFMADDMLGTGGTLLKAMKTLHELGASRIICAVSLPVFSGSAIEDFERAYRSGLIYRLIGTNAIYHDESLLSREWYLSADICQLFARAICRLHNHRSVGSLMDNRRIIKQLLNEAMSE
jgi:ribose-phosphate pyrophosphokinase